MKNSHVPVFPIPAFPPFVAKRARIEMVPLIDMFFLLLVFFVFGVFSMSMQQGILVELPEAATAAASKGEAIAVSITADRRLFVNQVPVTLERLPARLSATAAGGHPLVVIQADRAVAHGLVVSVLDRIRQAGLSRVSFQTAPADAQ